MIGWETILASTEEHLRQRLPAKLAEVASRFPDGVPLPEPRVYLRHASGVINVYPAVYVVPGEGARAEKQHQGWTTFVRDVVVTIEVEASRPEELASALYRYDIAIIEAILRPPYPDPAHDVRFDRQELGPVFDVGTGAMFRSWIEEHFAFRVYEENLT